MKRIVLAALVLLSIFFSFADLGERAFMDYDEAAYAQIYHESASRSFLNFTYLGVRYFEKPPLYFWLMRFSGLVFGESEFSLRFPSAILTICSILLVFLIVFELTKNSTAGLFSAAVLLTTAHFIFTGRQLRFDIPVTATVLLSFYAFVRAQRKPSWFILFAIGVAGGILFKSVIGMLIFPIILVYSFVYKKYEWLKDKWFWASIMLAFFLILPWHLYQHFLFGQAFWKSYLFEEVLNRVTDVILPGKEAPFFYHFQQLFVVTQPWFLIFIFLGVVFILFKKSKSEDFRFASFTLLTAIILFVFFYIPRTKLLYYFIPMLPFMAMFIGVFCASLMKRFPYVLYLFFVFCLIGLIHTLLIIFADQERGFFLEATTKISRYEVAQDEKIVSRIAADEKLPLYLYKWQFFPTLLYYTDRYGRVKLGNALTSPSLTPPFLLLVPTPLAHGSLELSLGEQVKAEALFEGKAAVLLKIVQE